MGVPYRVLGAWWEQGRFGVNGAGVAECPRCRGSFVEVLTELERRRIQVASPLRQVRVAATNIMPGRRVTANDIVYTFFLFDTDVQRHVVRWMCACTHMHHLYTHTTYVVVGVKE